MRFPILLLLLLMLPLAAGAIANTPAPNPSAIREAALDQQCADAVREIHQSQVDHDEATYAMFIKERDILVAQAESMLRVFKLTLAIVIVLSTLLGYLIAFFITKRLYRKVSE